MRRFKKLAVPGVQTLQPYIPGKPVEELERELGIQNSIKLASNENPLGASRKALQAMQQQCHNISIYPDGSGHKLSSALAKKHGVEPACITLGNGSNELLELVARTFLAPCHSAVYSRYSFAVYPLVIQAAGAEHSVAEARPADDDMPYGHDLQAMADSIKPNTQVIYLANPNNPTGTWLDVAELDGFIAAVPEDIIVVLDQAYYEYMPKHLQPPADTWLKQYPNLVITHTFSKIHGLAGLRIGYSVSHPEVADLLNRVRQPFNTNSLAQAAALAALDDNDHVNQSVATNNAGMVKFQQYFETAGYAVIPSMANFITVDFRQDGQALYQQLLHEGVIVRPLANYQMPQHLRITIGTAEQNLRVMQALEKVMA